MQCYAHPETKEIELTPSGRILKILVLGDFLRFQIFVDPPPPTIFFIKNRFPPTRPKTYPKHSSQLLLSAENELSKDVPKMDKYGKKKEKCDDPQGKNLPISRMDSWLCWHVALTLFWNVALHCFELLLLTLFFHFANSKLFRNFTNGVCVQCCSPDFARVWNFTIARASNWLTTNCN